ncbi:MAG: hypothetical protein IAG10_19865 [Planctomycetaceae bacterium]|nr:hypothetical protein [Planctomycetaceae bacterium]
MNSCKICHHDRTTSVSKWVLALMVAALCAVSTSWCQEIRGALRHQSITGRAGSLCVLPPGVVCFSRHSADWNLNETEKGWTVSAGKQYLCYRLDDAMPPQKGAESRDAAATRAPDNSAAWVFLNDGVIPNAYWEIDFAEKPLKPGNNPSAALLPKVGQYQGWYLAPGEVANQLAKNSTTYYQSYEVTLIKQANEFTRLRFWIDGK